MEKSQVYIAGCYTGRGGPGLMLLEKKEKRLYTVDVWRGLCDPIWAEKGKDGVFFAACADENGDGVVASLRVEAGKIRCLSTQPTGGRDTCHLTLDEQGETLYAANYADGSLAVFPVRAGVLLPRTQLIRHMEKTGPHPTRQENCHIHQTRFRPGTDEVFVCDLGADAVMVYLRQADGTLAFQKKIQAESGTGPRHLLFDGPERFFLVGELTGWLSEYALVSGEWRLRQTVSTLPEGFAAPNTAAAIRKKGDTLYVSNRGHDSIAVFAHGADGLKRAGWIMTPGKLPRDFLLTEEGFLVAQQGGGGIALLDEKGAVLDAVDQPGMVCLLQLG